MAWDRVVQLLTCPRPGSSGSLVPRVALHTDMSSNTVGLMGHSCPLLHLFSSTRPAPEAFTQCSYLVRVCAPWDSQCPAMWFPLYLQVLMPKNGHPLRQQYFRTTALTLLSAQLIWNPAPQQYMNLSATNTDSVPADTAHLRRL